MAQYLHKPRLGGSDGVSDRAVAAQDFPEQLGALGEFLTLTEWEDGSKRATGSVTIFCEDGVLKACLSDKTDRCVAFVSGGSWCLLLNALEEGIREGTLDWRRSKPYKKG